MALNAVTLIMARNPFWGITAIRHIMDRRQTDKFTIFDSGKIVEDIKDSGRSLRAIKMELSPEP